MKKLIMIALLALTVSCGVTQIGGLTPTVDIIETNHSKDDNYIRANEWMVETFGKSKSVIQFSDKEAGIVKGRYSLHYTAAVTAGILSTPEVSNGAIITIKVKDKASKITIDASRELFYPSSVKHLYNIHNAQLDIIRLMADFEERMLEQKEDF